MKTYKTGVNITNPHFKIKKKNKTKQQVYKLSTCLYLLIYLSINQINAQAVQNKNIDLVNITLDLNITPLQPQLTGKVTHDIKFLNTNTTKLQLALHQNYTLNANESSITNLESIDYTIQRNQSLIDITLLPSAASKINKTNTYSITISYSGTIPDEGTYSIHGFKDSQKYVATFSEPFGEKDWWPVFNTDLFNKYETMTMILNFPKQYKGASNGILMSETTSNGIKRQTWKHSYPIESYLIALAVGEYSEYHFQIDMLNGNKLDVKNYIFPNNLEIAKQNLGKLQSYMRVLETRLGDYPYSREKYGHASFGYRGGMEHQTISFIGEGWWSHIIIHELVHQWFGDLVTTHSWEQIWLNEGIATYFEYVVIDDLNEKPEDVKKKLQWFKDLSKFYKPRAMIVQNSKSTKDIFHSSIYNKGAFITHKLRVLVGDDVFFRALKSYLEQYKYQYVTIDNLKNSFKKFTELDIDLFFEHWVFNGEFPDLDVNLKVLEGENSYELTIAQKHGVRPYYYMKIPVEFTYEDGSKEMKLYLLDIKNKKINLNTEKPLMNIKIDPNNDALVGEINYTSEGFKYILGMTRKIQEEGLIAYPNPIDKSNNYISLEFKTTSNDNQEINISIVNNYGIEHYTQDYMMNNAKIIKVPIYDLAKGTYLILIKTEGKILAKRVLIK